MKSKILKNYLILTIIMLAIEFILRSVAGSYFWSWSLLRIFISISFISLFLAVIFSSFKDIVTKILNIIFLFLVSIYAFAQIGFNDSIGTFMSVNSSSQLDKVTSYIIDYIGGYSWNFYLVLIPFIVLILYYIFLAKKVDKLFYRPRVRNYLISIIFLIIFGLSFYLTLTLSFMQNKYQIVSNKNLFYYPETPSVCVNEFGITTYAIIDFKAAILNIEIEETVNETKSNEVKEVNSYTRLIDDSLWEQVIENETNSSYKVLNDYFINRDITSKNEMTGYFKDKNLIVILLESVNNIPFLYPEYFPNINKMYNEGWSWVNNYSPRNSCATANNEMTVMTSLFTIVNCCTANTYKNNVYPEAIFNLFNNAGYYTSSYHDYADHYYARKTYHINMGSTVYYNAYDLGIRVNTVYEEWPSDTELFTNSVEYYMENDKFMTFFTTVTAHRPYTVSSEYGDKYLDLFTDLDLPKANKRYLSKLKELDNALGELLNELSESGKLDDTVIVLFADHYPYGLSNSNVAEFLGEDILEGKERDRTPFIIYNPNLEPTKFEDYTTIVNILPTLANLFDLDYDPRLYMGTDLFSSDYQSLAVFADGSWVNEIAYYDASNSKVTYKNSTNTIADDTIININQDINNRLKMSALAIRKDYFNYLEEAKNKYIEITTDSIS